MLKRSKKQVRKEVAAKRLWIGQRQIAPECDGAAKRPITGAGRGNRGGTTGLPPARKSQDCGDSRDGSGHGD